MAKQLRPSVHLQERCEDLERVLDYFLAARHGQAPGTDERLIIFLSQIGFWEWELDNLTYAFASFKERSTAWEHENGFGFAHALRAQGILVQNKAVAGMKLKRQARAEWQRAVIAPVDALNKVIRCWNQILELCEERVLVPLEECKNAVELGAQVLADLRKFRKALFSEPTD